MLQYGARLLKRDTREQVDKLTRGHTTTLAHLQPPATRCLNSGNTLPTFALT